MQTENRVLGYIVITICALGLMFGVAAIFVPDFRDNGPWMVGSILGALGSLAAVIVGTSAAKRYTEKGNGDGAP